MLTRSTLRTRISKTLRGSLKISLVNHRASRCLLFRSRGECITQLARAVFAARIAYKGYIYAEHELVREDVAFFARPAAV